MWMNWNHTHSARPGSQICFCANDFLVGLVDYHEGTGISDAYFSKKRDNQSNVLLISENKGYWNKQIDIGDDHN